MELFVGHSKEISFIVLMVHQVISFIIISNKLLIPGIVSWSDSFRPVIRIFSILLSKLLSLKFRFFIVRKWSANVAFVKLLLELLSVKLVSLFFKYPLYFPLVLFLKISNCICLTLLLGVCHLVAGLPVNLFETGV